jgi:hypothetical protein
MSHVSVTQSVFNALTSSVPLMAKITGVYDVVPEGTDGPYIALGYQQSLRGRIIDETERNWYYDLDIWSSYQGRKEVLEIADLVRAALPSEWFYEELTVLKDPSGWYHGVLTIKGYDR